VLASASDVPGGRIEATSGGIRAGQPAGGELAVSLDETPASDCAGESQGDGSPHGQRGLKVLVVDDNEDATELLAVTLESLGHVARIAHDGPGALEAVETFPFDVALLDIGLPGMSGYELARKLRDGPRGPKAHIVALTGYGGVADRQCAEEAGFDAHMVKPIDLDRLGKMLAALAPF
jgi:CheY-like chemotaxis protein